jgi:hypothetical protein
MLYTIQADDCHFDTGVLPNGHQVLIGIQLPEIVIVEFDPEGNFITTTTTKLSHPNLTPSLFDEAVQADLGRWKRKARFEPKNISVKAFFVTERWIGIADLPEHYRDFLDNPGNYSQDDAHFFTEEIQRWRAQGSFVLHFDEDYYYSREGELESS